LQLFLLPQCDTPWPVRSLLDRGCWTGTLQMRSLDNVSMYVCMRKFIAREFLQPKQTQVRARRPY